MPKQSRPPQQLESGVQKVLEEYAGAMKRSRDLAEARGVHESRFDRYHTLASTTTVTALTATRADAPPEAPAVEVELVRAAAPQGGAAEGAVVMLVHGGWFMYGSPRSMRHVAERISAHLGGVAVATPRLRLAPEATWPAPVEDLLTAYEYLLSWSATTTPATAPTTAPAAAARRNRIAIFAESSGAAVAIEMLVERPAASALLHDHPPRALALASPWLDLTCSNGSYLVNDGHDPVLRRTALLRMAMAYLRAPDADALHGGPTKAPMPLQAPDAAFEKFPPSLVHVGLTEVVLDDARVFDSRLLNAGVAGHELREFESVVHGWHSFFPVMPAAGAALAQIADFLGRKLELDPELINADLR